MHGGNLNQAAAEYNISLDNISLDNSAENWLDLSTGINPNGYPIADIPAALWQRLPLNDDGLIEAAQHYYQAPYVLATAGSQAAIQALPSLRAACNVAMQSTMYAEHASSWAKHGHSIHYFDSTPNATLLNKVEVLEVCNPNNPTGEIIQPETLLAWHAELSQKGGWLVVDEAFMDSTPELSLGQYTHLPNLIVLRSLGKFFGLAGARVGFVLAVQNLLAQLQDSLGPWPIAGPARYIATQALQNMAWQYATRSTLNVASLRLNTLLIQHGLTPQGGSALFQWVPSNNAQEIHIHLAQHGIWTRLFSQWSALRFGLPAANGWARLDAALLSLQKN